MADRLQDWVSRIREGEVRALARAITAIENRDADSVELLKALFPHSGKAQVIGLTGAPGSGKSTLVDQLARVYRQQGKTIGIVAVDPTSPYTGGAILGDRIRMQRHATDEGVFIRSLATRGHMGGLSRSTADVVTVLDAMGYPIVIVETVGVGQDEVDVVSQADTTVVVTVPGLGDDIQAIKAGILEIADVLCVNKADREGADRSVRHLIAMLELRPHEAVPVEIVKTVATSGEGIDALVAAIEQHRARQPGRGGDRRRQRALSMLAEVLDERVGDAARAALAANQALAEQVGDRALDPYHAAERLLPDVAARLADPTKP
jgi:LAO/AO transport system kinase